MSTSITRNWAYNILLQIVNLLLPVITVPYISRVLGANGIGIYSFTFATTQYFILVGTLGISMYGNRQIAYCRDDKYKMSKTFWSIYALNFITTIMSLIVYFILFCHSKDYAYIYIIQSLNIIASVIDITWLYMGLEDFQKTVTRNMMVKIIGVICIFIFVKNKNDLYKYTFINGIMIVLGNAVMWLYLPKTVEKVKITIQDVLYHVKPTIQLFIPQIAIQVYAVLDKTMLGVLSTKAEVGVYEQSQKIIKLVLALVTSLGVVMLPRMSNMFAKGNTKKMDEYLNKTLIVVSYISIPMMFGIAGIAKEFNWFFGPEFLEVSTLMIILSPILYFIAISNVLGTQYLLPSNRTRQFTTSVVTGAIVNVIFNLILITKFKAIGACISTLLAEFSVTLIQVVYLRKNITKKQYIKNVWKYFVASAIMYLIVRFIGASMGIRVITTVVQVIVGVLIYFVLMVICKDSVSIAFCNKIKAKILRNKKC